MNKRANEIKVGLLVLMALLVVLLFAWLIGGHNPFRKEVKFFVTYDFAGGIEKGSPVRLSGIKVGQVEKINFIPPEEVIPAAPVPTVPPGETEPAAGASQGNPVITPLKIQVSIEYEAAQLIRQNSKFYINLAGLIGERYLEITPGTTDSPPVAEGDVLRGIDPPRIDQLISQSFNLAGKIQEILESHEGDIAQTFKLLNNLSANLNKSLAHIEKSKLLKTDVKTLVDNLIVISEDVKKITHEAREMEFKRDLERIRTILKRAEEVDKAAVKELLQKEGIRVRLF